MDPSKVLKGHQLCYFEKLNKIIIKNCKQGEIINTSMINCWRIILEKSSLHTEGEIFQIIKYLLNSGYGSTFSMINLSLYLSKSTKSYHNYEQFSQLLVKTYNQDIWRLREADLTSYSRVHFGYNNHLVTKTKSYENLQILHSEGLRRSKSVPCLKARTSDDFESEKEDTELNSEGISNSTVIKQVKIDLKSIKSSTDTLVADTGILPDMSCKPVCTNKTEKLDLRKATDDCQITYATESYTANRLAEKESSLESFALKNTMSELNNGMGIDTTTTQCEVCETSKKLLGDLAGTAPLNIVPNTLSNNCSGMATTASWHGGKYSKCKTPILSTTPSTGIPTTPVGIDDSNILTQSRNRQNIMDAAACSRSSSRSSGNNSHHSRSNFDVDGLTTLHDEIQSEVNVIISGYKVQVESLHRELEVTRFALMKQVGHKCTHVALDRADDNVSLADSVCSGEHHFVGRESQHSHSSAFSWEAVEEKQTRPSLCLPNFAVTRCMGCEGKFWLGRPKHPCRSCGKIFCSDCSEHTMTIPNENIYTPVRVCMSCYYRQNSLVEVESLHRDRDVTPSCKDKKRNKKAEPITPGRLHLCRAVRNDCHTNSHNTMMGSYAAAVSGESSFQINDSCSSSYQFETHRMESGSNPSAGFAPSGYGSRFSVNDVTMLNDQTCNDVSNAVPSKSNHNGVTADIQSSSNGVSNGHPE